MLLFASHARNVFNLCSGCYSLAGLDKCYMTVFRVNGVIGDVLRQSCGWTATPVEPHHRSELPPGAVYCKFDRLLPFSSNHAVNAPYSCSFLSKFESSLGKRLGCASALDTVLLFVLCMHSAKPVQNIQLSPQIREFVLSHFTGCFLLWKKRKRNFISDEGE